MNLPTVKKCPRMLIYVVQAEVLPAGRQRLRLGGATKKPRHKSTTVRREFRAIHTGRSTQASSGSKQNAIDGKGERPGDGQASNTYSFGSAAFHLADEHVGTNYTIETRRLDASWMQLGKRWSMTGPSAGPHAQQTAVATIAPAQARPASSLIHCTARWRAGRLCSPRCDREPAYAAKPRQVASIRLQSGGRFDADTHNASLGASIFAWTQGSNDHERRIGRRFEISDDAQPRAIPKLIRRNAPLVQTRAPRASRRLLTLWPVSSRSPSHAGQGVRHTRKVFSASLVLRLLVNVTVDLRARPQHDWW
jgi:hypothetical protein